MKRELAYYGDPILRKKAAEVTEFNEETRELIKDMHEIMLERRGIGIAAPQVHVSLRIFMINPYKQDEETKEWVPATTTIFVNPKIIEVGEQLCGYTEGCLSIPKIYEEVIRPYRVTVQALDENFQPFERTFDGMEGRIILHENDHINGVLFIDRLPTKRRKELDPLLNEIKRRFYLNK